MMKPLNVLDVCLSDGDRGIFVNGELLLVMGADLGWLSREPWLRQDDRVQVLKVDIEIKDLGVPEDEWQWEDVVRFLESRGIIGKEE